MTNADFMLEENNFLVLKVESGFFEEIQRLGKQKRFFASHDFRKLPVRYTKHQKN